VGKAENNKRDKYERILAAARDLFRTRGYELTTMDDIAQRAGVAKGSVFFHARSKAALLNQVFQIDMERWVHEAFGQPPQPSVLDDLVAKFGSLLAAMCAQPELTRVYMRDVAFASDDAERADDTMSLLLGLTESVIENAKADNQLPSTVNSAALAFNLFATYFVGQIAWLRQPSGRAGDPRDHLRPLFATQLNVLAPPGPPTAGGRRRSH
jgi:AcrR family transcriptional regulator